MGGESRPFLCVFERKNMSIKTYDFRCFHLYDYHVESNCSERGCDNEGICRCGEIIDTKITKVKPAYEFVDDEYRTYSTIDKYCVERLLSLNGFWNPDNYDFKIGGDYYGEELEEILFSNGEVVQTKVNDGYVLDSLKQFSRADMKSIDKSEISFGNEEYRKKVNSSMLEYYTEYTLPRGIVSLKNGKYKLYDGYHRVSAAKDFELLNVWVLR